RARMRERARLIACHHGLSEVFFVARRCTRNRTPRRLNVARSPSLQYARSPYSARSAPCTSAGSCVTSACAASVVVRLCTSPRGSVPTCSFIPKNQVFPFLVCGISGSRACAAFLVELGAAMIVASTIVPDCRSRRFAVKRSRTAAKIASVRWCSSEQLFPGDHAAHLREEPPSAGHFALLAPGQPGERPLRAHASPRAVVVGHSVPTPSPARARVTCAELP